MRVTSDSHERCAGLRMVAALMIKQDCIHDHLMKLGTRWACSLCGELFRMAPDEPESPLSGVVWKSGSADGEPWAEVALGPMVMTEDENFVHIRPAFDPASIPDCPRCGAQHWPQCPSEKSSCLKEVMPDARSSGGSGANGTTVASPPSAAGGPNRGGNSGNQAPEVSGGGGLTQIEASHPRLEDGLRDALKLIAIGPPLEMHNSKVASWAS
jgi:hypothetical protein